jgi:uroporphyrinogen III methyltransferase/synthase
MNKGKVYLIGAGPGDPELLTLKGKRCLGEADVIVGDYLADKRILKFANLMLNIFMLAKKWAATR